jgi:uncharacterized protein YndB with AHSA1/START domain
MSCFQRGLTQNICQIGSDRPVSKSRQRRSTSALVGCGAAPDGRRYPNRMQFRRIEPPTLIEIDHGADDIDDPGRFRTTITFDEQSDGKTVITLRQLHPTKAQRDAKISFGAVEYGYQTLEKLAHHVESLRA